MDDYNFVFYKRAWLIIKKIEIIEVAQELFTTGIIYRGINCTSVTLIPKVANPATIKKYRPIACCTVLYKIIAKILAGRIHKVIASLIIETQLGFITGRKVTDNVILAH